MYLPAHFEPPDTGALHALMREHPLAALVTSGADGLTADHVPFELDGAAGAPGRLLGHVARANPLWRQASGTPVLAIFSGPQAYISPSWYPSKALTHKVVPTWNYAVVHAHGRLRAVDDTPWLQALVQRLTRHHEAAQTVPWAVSDAPEDYVQQMLRAIVGIEIEITRLVGKFKLSQNRSEADRRGVAAGLRDGQGSARELAATMDAPLTPAITPAITPPIDPP
ncbi:MAG: FMN-binding negative transcriptional regulator [Rubrivivax sp.]|nr:FMN-binding negative transcriptional regulator [Rubrivivax sp.]